MWHRSTVKTCNFVYKYIHEDALLIEIQGQQNQKLKHFGVMRYIWSYPLFPVIVAYMKVRDPYLPKTCDKKTGEAGTTQTTWTTLITYPPKIIIYALFKGAIFTKEMNHMEPFPHPFSHLKRFDRVEVCGSVPQLGSWKLSEAANMQCQARGPGTRVGSWDPGMNVKETNIQGRFANQLTNYDLGKWDGTGMGF